VQKSKKLTSTPPAAPIERYNFDNLGKYTNEK
jgi:hypothetical protein